MSEFYMPVEGTLQCFLEALTVRLVEWHLKMLA